MTLNLQPVLVGRYVKLVPLKESDLDVLYPVASDPLIWEQHPEKTRYQRDVFQKYFDSAVESKGALLVYDVQTNELLGCTRYYDYHEMEKVITIGYTFLSRSCWGKPFNREMKKLMMEYAFNYAERILFVIGEHNIRSRKAVEKIGGKLEGKENNSVIYEITKESYFSNPIII